MGTPDLVIAICTLGRPSALERLLGALTIQEWPPGSAVLVVDNDPAMSAKSIVDAARDAMSVPVTYVIEPRRGFATVRNRVFDELPDAAAVVFIDDDAVVPTDWVTVMDRMRAQHPGCLVRSRYAHVAQVPRTGADIAEAAAQLAPLEAHGPAGTSGLLLPADVRAGLRFDPYFDRSGGEDVHLLTVLSDRGVRSVVAPTLVLEGARSQVLTRAQQLELARWNGRMTIAVIQRTNKHTLSLRFRSTACAIPAAIKGAVRQACGRSEAATGHLAYAANLWAQATAPRQAPVSLGSRPDF